MSSGILGVVVTLSSDISKPLYEIAPPEMPAVLGWVKRKNYKFEITERL